MSYPAHVTDTVYRYDGTFQGFLCCIFESYSRKEIPAAVCAPDRGQISFYDSCEIVTDPARAQRVARGLERLGPTVKERITTGFLSALKKAPLPRVQQGTRISVRRLT